MTEKEGIVKYVKIVKRLFIVFSCIALPAFMICLVFAFGKMLAFQIAAPLVGVGYLAVYAFYALRVSMGTVLGIEVTEQVVYVKTKRKTFTYDLVGGCVSVKETKRKFVAVFETQDSRDSFLFYRRVLFTPWHEEQFTREDIAVFYPAILRQRETR